MDLPNEKPVKRVVFSPKLRIMGSSGVKLVDMETEYYDVGDLISGGRNHLRTPIGRDPHKIERLNTCEVALLIIVVVTLFFIIWYICYSVLLVEIDTQINGFTDNSFVVRQLYKYFGSNNLASNLFFL